MDGSFVFLTLPWWTFSTRGYEPQCSRPEVIDTTALPLYKLFLDLKTAEFETVGHYPVDNFGWNKYNKNQSSLIPCISKSYGSPFQTHQTDEVSVKSFCYNKVDGLQLRKHKK